MPPTSPQNTRPVATPREHATPRLANDVEMLSAATQDDALRSLVRVAVQARPQRSGGGAENGSEGRSDELQWKDAEEDYRGLPWAAIAEQFPGRSANVLRNAWVSRLCPKVKGPCQQQETTWL